MDSATTQLGTAAHILLEQLAHFRVRSATDSTPIDISSLEPETIDALFRMLPPTNVNQSKDLASLLGESRICLQLIIGFLDAVRGVPSLPAVVRFEVPGHRGHVIPVTMPPASAAAMIRDAKRLASALKKLGRIQEDA